MSDSYSKWVMTSAFVNNTQAAINSGKQIEWVSVKTSDDTHSIGDLSGFNDITLSTASIKQTSNVSTVTVKGNTVTITGILNNASNTSDYYIRTLFLVARYNGTEFLAAATIANTASSAFRMPAASTTEITEFTVRPQISVTNVNTISTTVNPVAAATNERVNQLESNLQDKIDNINEDKKNLWVKLSEYVTKNTAETINGIKTFSQTIVGSITGNSGSATKLKNSRKIGGVAFDGTKDISLPGVDKSGNQDTSGKAASAAKLSTARKISLTGGAKGSVQFDGSTDAEIDVTSLDATYQKAKVVEFGTDLDSLVTSGFYVSNGKTLVNSPLSSDNTFASILVINNDSNGKNASMIYQDTNANRIWIRQRKSSTWKSWYELFKQGDKFQGDLFVVAPDNKIARISLVNDQGEGSQGLIRYSATEFTGNTFQGITALSDNGSLVIGGGEGVQEFAKALSTGIDLGSIGDYGLNATNERAYILGDGGVLIIPNASAYQNVTSGTAPDALFWEFKNNGSLRTPIGTLLSETSDGKWNFKTISGTKMMMGTNIDGESAKASAPSVQGINPGTDLNKLVTPGFYSFQDGLIKNSPIPNYFTLNVYNIGPNNGVQILINSFGNIWTRGWYPQNAWSDWKESSQGVSTTKVYGSGKLFDKATYLTFVKSGKVVSVYGTLNAVSDITGLFTYQGETLIPDNYRPAQEFRDILTHNSSNGSNKIRGDVAYGSNGVISIDDVTIGSSDVMNGVIPKGTPLRFSATWVTL